MEEFELEPGEEIIATVRQHPFVLALRLLPLLVLAFLPSLLGGFFSAFASLAPEAGGLGKGFDLPSSLDRFLTGFWLLLLWTSAFSIVTRYYLTQWVITNIRIVDIKQVTFFSRAVSSFFLIRVQDITTDVSGLIATLVGFGRLDVETAGSSDRFSMDNISDPAQVRDVIMSQVAQLHHNEQLSGGV